MRHSSVYSLPRDTSDLVTMPSRFEKAQQKGTIDVWWIYDDGGKLTLCTGKPTYAWLVIILCCMHVHVYETKNRLHVCIHLYQSRYTLIAPVYMYEHITLNFSQVWQYCYRTCCLATRCGRIASCVSLLEAPLVALTEPN